MYKFGRFRSVVPFGRLELYLRFDGLHLGSYLTQLSPLSLGEILSLFLGRSLTNSCLGQQL
jgi:hypothetical protein